MNLRRQKTVDVEGAVVALGVYTIPLGARVDDAIAAAGGLANNTDQEHIAKTINRAGKLSGNSLNDRRPSDLRGAHRPGR